MKQALVLDGNLKSALSAVRSLGKRGIAVTVGAERKTGMALHSKYAIARFVYPSPYTAQEAFIECVKNEALQMGGKPVVYTFSDATFLSLYAFRDSLSECMTLVYTDAKSIEIAFDKAATYSLAHISGIPTIPTHALELMGEVQRLSETVEYPVVLKTRRSVSWKDGIGVFGTAQFIHAKEELVKKFSEIKEQNGEAPLIQTMIYGEEYGVEMLAQNGKVFATGTHHRIRSLSPTGGASVLKETIDDGELKNTLEEYALILVSKLKWSGPIMVEFKVDSDSKAPYLMEINGRFWGSLPLAVASGVDMPYVYYEYAQKGIIPDAPLVAQESVTTRHFFGDVRHLLRVWFARDRMRSYLYPKRISALSDFFSLPKGTKSDVWRWTDPLPAFMEIADILIRIWK